MSISLLCLIFLHEAMPLAHRGFWIPLSLNFAMPLFLCRYALLALALITTETQLYIEEASL